MEENMVRELIDYMSLVPGLNDFFIANKDKYGFEQLISIFKEEYATNGDLPYEIDLSLKIIIEKYNHIREKSSHGIHFINRNQQVDDNELLNTFSVDTNGLYNEKWTFKKASNQHYKTITEKIAYRNVDFGGIIDKYIDNDHPYICAQIAIAYLNAKQYNTGLVFLQKALTHVFSFPNIYWHNPVALYGCVDALYEFQYLLGPSGMDSLNERIPGGANKILKCLYLYLSRAIYMGDSEPKESSQDEIPIIEAARIDYLNCRANLVLDYKPYFFSIFGLGVNPDIQYISDKANLFTISQEYGLALIYKDDYWDALKMYQYGSLIPNGSGGYHDIEDATFSELIQRGQFRADELANNLYKDYQNGEFYLSHSDLADCIAYIKEKLIHKTSLSFSEYLNKRSEAWIKAWKEKLSSIQHPKNDIQQCLKDQLYVEKIDATVIEEYLENNNIKCFYHFTDRRNLESIIKNGGLYSWKYSIDNGIKITLPGGDLLSRKLDERYGLEDYVRLSFCSDHPMTWRLKQNGADLVLLKIRTDVAKCKHTLFSDMNAAARNHHHGDSFQDLLKVDVRATKRVRVRGDDPDFHKHQAEIMVKTFIPIEYIININSPDSI